jgi:5'-AMP-activated protein kinase catalytic alpha subunit
VQLYEIIETEDDLYLVMEFAQSGELFEVIVENQRLKEPLACKYFKELMAAINYIHSLGICHRDLKPENLLIDYDGCLKMVDFGLSNMYEKGELLKTACGSPCYAAPEVR